MYSNLANLIASAGPVFLAGSDWENITTSDYFQVKSGVSILSGVTVNTGGTTSTAELFNGTSSVVTMTKATPAVISWASHPFSAGDAVRFTTTGALYTGLTAGTTYYVSTAGLTADEFVVADTQAHALAGTNSIAMSGTESGVQTAWDVTRPIGTYDTTTRGNIPAGANGLKLSSGLIAVTADGGTPANLTIAYF